MSQAKVLFLPRTTLAQDIVSEKARHTLESIGPVVWNPMNRDYSMEELIELLPGAAAVVTSWGSLSFTPELLTAADKLQIVGHAAGSVKSRMPKEGYDRGIVVLSAAAVIADSVAEYTLWAMLSMMRDLYPYEQIMKKGWWLEAFQYGFCARVILQESRARFCQYGRSESYKAVGTLPM